MHPELNPFTPGSGLRPPTLAGRAREVEAFDLIVARTRRRLLSASLLLHGYRGVGKTVLLRSMRQQAERAGWLCVDIEGQTSTSGATAVRQQLARQLHRAANKFKNGKPYSEAVRTAFGTLTSFSISLGVVSVETARESPNMRARSGQLEVDLEELVDDFAPALHESYTAIGIFIDEMQDLDRELLAALLTVQNRAGQKDIPFFVVGAGLPSLPALLGKTRSYAERLFDYRQIDALEAAEARDALRRPFEERGARIAPDALELLASESSGYPYFIQVFGQAAWNEAVDNTVYLSTAQKAIGVGYQRLADGFFPARWDRATPAERAYMQTMSEMGDRLCPTAEIARRRGQKPADLSVVRSSLIEKGVIFAPEHGAVSFTVPGMPAFIKRQASQG